MCTATAVRRASGRRLKDRSEPSDTRLIKRSDTGPIGFFAGNSVRNLKRSGTFLVIDGQSAVATALAQDGPDVPDVRQAADRRPSAAVLTSKSIVSIVEPHVEVAGVRPWEHARCLILCTTGLPRAGCNDGTGPRCQ